MSLDEQTFDDAYKSTHATIDKKNKNDLVDAWVDAYETHALEAVGTTVTITAIGKAAMKDAVMTWSGTTLDNTLKLATAIANFWAAEAIPGPGFVSVTNNATSKIAALDTAIRSSISHNVSNHSANRIIKDTDTIVKTIIYTGIPVGSSPTPVPATIT